MAPGVLRRFIMTAYCVGGIGKCLNEYGSVTRLMRAFSLSCSMMRRRPEVMVSCLMRSRHALHSASEKSDGPRLVAPLEPGAVAARVGAAIPRPWASSIELVGSMFGPKRPILTGLGDVKC